MGWTSSSLCRDFRSSISPSGEEFTPVQKCNALTKDFAMCVFLIAFSFSLMPVHTFCTPLTLSPRLRDPFSTALRCPQVAMHFVKDNHIRFNLAIECGNLQVAKDTAMELKNPECWRTLADVAMKHGNVQVGPPLAPCGGPRRHCQSATQQLEHGIPLSCTCEARSGFCICHFSFAPPPSCTVIHQEGPFCCFVEQRPSF